MGERIGASSSEPVHPLIEKALTSKIPIAELIGFGVEEIGGGRAVASLRPGPQHANPMGTLHGDVLCDLFRRMTSLAITSCRAVVARFGRDPRHRASLLQHDLLHVQPVGPRGNPRHPASRGTASTSLI
jgi:acyl-coenzyme A thioesterase PaaI-like protein